MESRCKFQVHILPNVDVLKQPEKKQTEIETERERERRQNKKRRAGPSGPSGPWDACECSRGLFMRGVGM